MAIRNVLPCQSRVRRWYTSDPVQISLAFLIFLNFMISIIRAELPDGDAQYEGNFEDNTLQVQIFHLSEVLFNSIFAVELLINLYGHWLKPFWQSAWNVFDFVVVVSSALSLFIDDIPGFSVLRLF